MKTSESTTPEAELLSVRSEPLLGADMTPAETCEHIETCPGCEYCEGQLEFYGGCDACGEGGHKDAMHYDPSTGKTLCSGCFHAAPNADLERSERSGDTLQDFVGNSGFGCDA